VRPDRSALHGGVEQLGLFITWLRHAGSGVSGPEAASGGQVLVGPGQAPVRGARRVNAVLAAVRGFVAHAVSVGQASAGLLAMVYELADERGLPEQARGEDARMGWRMRARHRLREPDRAVERADDEQIVALLRGCRSARDRLIVLLMARAGLRRGRAVRTAPRRRAPVARLTRAGLRGPTRAPARDPPGQRERRVGEVAAPAGGAAGGSGCAGL